MAETSRTNSARSLAWPGWAYGGRTVGRLASVRTQQANNTAEPLGDLDAVIIGGLATIPALHRKPL